MATDLVVPEHLQKNVGPLTERFAKDRAELMAMATDLSERPATDFTAALAVEYDTRAKAFEVKAKEAFAPMIAVAFKTHRGLTGVLNGVLAPAARVRSLASSKISQYALSVEKQKHAARAAAERAEIGERKDETLEGVSLVETWEVEITDFAKWVDHISAHHELLYLLLPVQGDLNRLATRLRGKLDHPGTTVLPRMVTRNRNNNGQA